MAITNVALQINDATKIYGHSLKIGKGKVFGEKTLGIQKVNLTVLKGEIFGFLGPNGAGKTTTIRAVLDYLHIQNGSIKILARDHKRDRVEIRKHIGYVPGEMSLFDNFTGLELLSYLNNFRPINTEFLNELKTIFTLNIQK